MRTTDVRFWDPRKHPGRKSGSYEVRWVVAGKVRSRSRRTKELAESFLSELRQAARRGELFDIDTGLPESMLPAVPTITWVDFAQHYVDMKWPRSRVTRRPTPSLRSRRHWSIAVPPLRITGASTDVTGVLIAAAGVHADRPPEIQDAVDWLSRHSLAVSDLTDKRHLRAALELRDSRQWAGMAISRHDCYRTDNNWSCPDLPSETHPWLTKFAKPRRSDGQVSRCFRSA